MTTLQETLDHGQAVDVPVAAGPARDRANHVAAAGVGLFIFSLYAITLSPDVSFWDAGEFIATSHTLGIPHPPGTPLYVLMGRVFSLLFHSLLGVASPAQAVNLLSAIPSALAAVFLHLCVVRVGKKIWAHGDQSAFCFPALVAGVTAALFAAFSSTLWVNSIEAEVYAVSGMWSVFTAWLILVWADTEPRDERLLVVIAYLLALNIGVHLATYLAALAILPFAFLYEKRLAIPVAYVVVLTMARDLQFFLIVVGLLLLPTLQLAILPASYKKRYRSSLLSAHAIAIAIALWAVLGEAMVLKYVLAAVAMGVAFALPFFALPLPKKWENPITDLGFVLALVTVLGFSCHLYLPIRSALDPAINEGQPDTWAAFWKVILRDQYKPVSVQVRQAAWIYQIDHMFWRYFREQWSPAFLMLLGLPGILVHWRRHRRTFVLFGLLFLWTSAALVLKMNFTDHEVRERDYFFAGGFFYYTVWMGLCLGWLADLAVTGVGKRIRVPMMAVTALLCVTIAAVPIRGNWRSHDRRGNWVAHDYAYNMLAALEPDAILFTNGDNDTFPLWYLQEVDGFRKDVRIVNLSLLNTPWYGEQLRNQEPRVPMSLSTEELWQLRPMRHPTTGEVYLVKDLVGNDIVQTVEAQGGDRPVYFAVTVDDLLGYDDRLKLEGLVFRLHADSAAAAGEDLAVGPGPLSGDAPTGEGIPEIVGDVNMWATRRNLEEVYRYRGLLEEDGSLDTTVYRDENEQKLITNYAAAWARMSLAYRDLHDLDQAVSCLKQAIAIAPRYDPIVGGLGGMLLEQGDVEGAREFFLARLETHPEDIRVYIGLAYVARRAENWDEAAEWYLRGLRVEPDARNVLAGLYEARYNAGRYEEAEAVLLRWLQIHPTDESARSELAKLRRLMHAEIGEESDPN